MALNISGRMKVKTLQSDFKEEFGLTLRVYDGRNFADGDATLASIRKGDSKGGEFSPKRNTKVGNLEDKIMEMFGIKTQVAGSDDSYLCDNDLTLAGALEENEKKLVRKEKKANSEFIEMLDDSNANEDEGNWWDEKESVENEEDGNKYRIYLTAEPSGEYCLGRLSEDDILELKSYCAKEDEFGNSNFVQMPFDYDNIGHVYGISLEENVFSGANFIEEGSGELVLPSEEGIYLVASTPTKMSIDFRLDVSEKDFDMSKLTVKYQEINLSELENSYGEIWEKIIVGIEYDGKDYTDVMMDSIVDSGYSYEGVIFNLNDGDIDELVKFNADGVHYWVNCDD